MRKIACMFLLALVIVSGFLFFEDAQATTVSGALTSDTTWTKANSPYTITGKIIIPAGVSLTIEPGVTVSFQSNQMEVNGILHAVGTSSNKIVLSSSSETLQKIEFTISSSNCIIKNAIISQVPIVINNASPEISHNYFTSTPLYVVTVNGGSPSILNNVVNNRGANGIHVNNGNPLISDNVIRGEGHNYGIYTTGMATIISNNITNCYTGIYAVGRTTIRQNIVMHNIHDGIRSEDDASVIEYNVVASNDCGISGKGNLLHNTVANNAVAGLWSPSPTATIYNNNIFSNYENVHLTENATDVQAQYNWWGTTDPEAISQTIWDFKDASHLGNLVFTPFLTEPTPSAPAIPSTIPMPTVPPTSTTNTPTPSTSTPPAFVTQEPTATPLPPQTLSPTRIPYVTQMPVEPPSESGNVNLTDLAILCIAIVFSIAIVTLIMRLHRKNPQPTTVNGSH